MSKTSLTFLLGAVLVLGSTMCQYDPNPKSGQMSCSDSGKCPSGFECSRVDNMCYRPEELPASSGGSTASSTASTAGAAGAAGGNSAAITSSKTVTGGATSSKASSSVVTGGSAGASIPVTSVIAGSSSRAGATGGGSTSLFSSTSFGGGGGGGSSSRTGGTSLGGTSSAVAGSVSTGGGGSTMTSSSIAIPSGTAVTFSSGKAKGAMMGYGWVVLGSKDSISDPKCGTSVITSTTTCASTTWSTKDSLCMSGSIPALDATTPDYTGNWGVALGLNSTDPAGGGLGQSFTSIAIAISGTPSSGLRAKVHLKGDPESTDYCQAYASGGLAFTSFTKTCYDTAKPGTAITAADVPKIDQISIQVPSASTAITVSNLCITGITFAK